MNSIETLLDRYLASSTPGEANRLWNAIERQSYVDAHDGNSVDQARLTKIYNMVVDRFEATQFAPSVVVAGGYDHSIDIRFLSSPTFIGLRRGLRDLNPGSIPIFSDYDCTGRICGQHAKFIKVYRSEGQWIGVVEVSITRDV